MKFAARRSQLGITKRQLAIAVGTTPSNIISIEKGSMPRVDLAIKLAKRLHTTVEELWG